MPGAIYTSEQLVDEALQSPSSVSSSDSNTEHDSAKLIASLASKAQLCRNMAEACVAKERPLLDRTKPYQPPSHLDANIYFEQNSNRMDAIISTLDTLDLRIWRSNDETAYLDCALMSIFNRMLKRESDDPLKRGKVIVEIPKPEVRILAEPKLVAELVDKVMTLAEREPEKTITIAVDLEGYELGRNGTISIIQIYNPVLDTVYLLDIVAMGAQAFTTSSTDSNRSMKQMLESRSIVKLLFDCRGDNDALYHLYGVSMSAVVDLQLADLATRQKAGDRRKVNSLGHALLQRLCMSEEDKAAWKSAKDWGHAEMQVGPVEAKRMYHESGGVFAKAESKAPESASPGVESDDAKNGGKVWLDTGRDFVERRPLSDIMVKYCVADVLLLPAFYKHCLEHRFWNDDWAKTGGEESARRLEESRADTFDRALHLMKAAPAGWNVVKQVDRNQQ